MKQSSWACRKVHIRTWEVFNEVNQLNQTIVLRCRVYFPICWWCDCDCCCLLWLIQTSDLDQDASVNLSLYLLMGRLFTLPPGTSSTTPRGSPDPTLRTASLSKKSNYGFSKSCLTLRPVCGSLRDERTSGGLLTPTVGWRQQRFCEVWCSASR